MKRSTTYVIAAGAVILTITAIRWFGDSGSRDEPSSVAVQAATEPKTDHVELSPIALKAANIETAEAESRVITALIAVTGAVEANQEKMQQVTPLVSGRVERVNVALGDRVQQGGILAVISSPEVAEMHGKFHQAETRFNLAQKNLDRVQRAENRAGVLQAKAKLDQAEANLRRTKRLTELGAAAGKDLSAAEAEYATAKAEYDYQSNILINREVQQAQGEMETARAEMSQLRSSLMALSGSVPQSDQGLASHDTSAVTLRSPMSGTVIERLVNSGAGIEAGKPIFTIADISTLWVIANVPEGEISALSVGSPAEIQHPELGDRPTTGRVAYVDPVLNEASRTGRVRVEIRNPNERLKVGMFVTVNFLTTGKSDGKTETSVVVPDTAVQRIGDRSVVFIPSDKPGEFEVRDVELGDAMGAMHQIRNGLKAGERVVTKGSFLLKTQLMKAQLGEG